MCYSAPISCFLFCCQFIDTCVQRMGPRNITRIEGELDVFIPCPLSGFVLPVWKINGYVYELFQLPELFTPAYGGIYIETITRQLNGTTMQCFVSTGKDGIVESSLIGMLTVVTLSGIVIVLSSTTCILTMHAGTNFESDFLQSISNSYLYLDHQNMIFGDKYVILAWKHTNLDCITYQIKLRHTCGYTSQLEHAWETTSQNVTVNESVTNINGSRTDIDIQLVNDDGFICKVMKETVQIHKSGRYAFLCYFAINTGLT